MDSDFPARPRERACVVDQIGDHLRQARIVAEDQIGRNARLRLGVVDRHRRDAAAAEQVPYPGRVLVGAVGVLTISAD